MTNQPLILIAEDDVNLLNDIRDILELQHYSVLSALNGSEALEHLQAGAFPDLIISDITMPEMNGYDFYTAVRKNPRWTRIPFIFLTAKGERADVRFGKAMGVDEYLIKPFSVDELLTIIAARLRRQEELEQIHSAEITDIKRGILTILNHELRTPLTFIIGYADLLNSDPGEVDLNEVRPFLNSMNEGAERLRHLIENLILLVELETGEATKNFADNMRLLERPELLLETVKELYEDAAHKHHLTLEIKRSPEPLPTMLVNDHVLLLALGALVDNAIKFSDKPGKSIQLSTSVDAALIYFHVADEGRGIPPDELDKIFEMFYQIDRHRHEDQGAGVGLTIVRRIAVLHHGRIDVESQVGKGSCFTIALPHSNI